MKRKKRKKKRERIYYYRFKQEPLETLGHGGYINEVALIKASRTAPTHVWIKNYMFPNRDKWSKLPGNSFLWWWDWFKDIKPNAVEREEWTKTKLFEEVGIDQL